MKKKLLYYNWIRLLQHFPRKGEKNWYYNSHPSINIKIYIKFLCQRVSIRCCLYQNKKRDYHHKIIAHPSYEGSILYDYTERAKSADEIAMGYLIKFYLIFFLLDDTSSHLFIPVCRSLLQKNLLFSAYFQ